MRRRAARVAHSLRRLVPGSAFSGSAAYWEDRYAAGSDSGAGSYGPTARFKAEFLNAFVAGNAIASVIEFGCGDGNQLSLAAYPAYTGVDVSATAVERCRARFAGDPTKRFETLDEYRGEQADLALSLDVVYHLVEDEDFEAHLRTLFAAAGRFAIVFSSNADEPGRSHVRHRRFTSWVEDKEPSWRLIDHRPNPIGSRARNPVADFFVFAVGADDHAR